MGGIYYSLENSYMAFRERFEHLQRLFLGVASSSWEGEIAFSYCLLDPDSSLYILSISARTQFERGFCFCFVLFCVLFFDELLAVIHLNFPFFVIGYFSLAAFKNLYLSWFVYDVYRHGFF